MVHCFIFRHSIGDTVKSFCLQSCSKPLTYALALNDLGCNTVHEYVGQEPSGETFNMIKLDRRSKFMIQYDMF